MRLRRPDGVIYLDRWGWECRFFGVFVHRMDGPDPGRDLHDHPWTFWSFVAKGGYCEDRAAQRDPDKTTLHGRSRWSVKVMRLDECHSVTVVDAPTWTIVLHGPKRRDWGFYVDGKWMPWRIYDSTIRAERRDMIVEISNTDDRPQRDRVAIS